MPVKQLDDLFEYGADVLGTTQTDQGTIMAQTGDVVGEFVSSNDVEVWGPPGYASRPAQARSGKDAAQAIAITRGSNDVIIAFRDIRASSLYGTLKEGETCVYAPGPQNSGTCNALFQNDGSATTITFTAQTTNVNSGHVNLGNGASEGVVCGGSAFTSWASSVVTAINALNVAVATKAAVQGSPIDPSVGGNTVSSFPSNEISTVVKAAT